VHVAIDLRLLDREGMERTGIGRQALESMGALRAARTGWRLSVLTNRSDLVGQSAGTDVLSTRWPTSSAAGRQAWLHLAAARAVRPAPDVWWSPAYVLPIGWRGRAVVTVHDLVVSRRPDLYRGRLRAFYFARAMGLSVRRADRVLCPSGVIGSEIVRGFGVEPARVVTVPWGLSAAFRNPPERTIGDYVLFAGRWEARKGLDVLDAAWRDAVRRGVELRLVLAGGPGWGAERPVERLGALPGVRLVRDPSDAELARLYAGAAAVVYPSRMEGFGLPVAEAMSCGCPVIASDLPEIRAWAEDAPAYVPAGDASALADAILALARDPERGRRMSERGREIASRLSWHAFGQVAADAIEATAGESSSRG
jgi:glycosyltransferase involved in cell wall biosynthesis